MANIGTQNKIERATSKYKPKINSEKSHLLSAPIMRFKHLKVKKGDPQWAHYERHHWKLQIAYSINKETERPDWFDVVDEYFYDDGEGQDEKEISFEEYQSDRIERKR